MSVLGTKYPLDIISSSGNPQQNQNDAETINATETPSAKPTTDLQSSLVEGVDENLSDKENNHSGQAGRRANKKNVADHDEEDSEIIPDLVSPKVLEYIWTPARKLEWIRSGNPLPQRVLDAPFRNFESNATPPNVDLSLIKIPITAMELLTFFPRHTNNYHFEHRLTSNGVLGNTQATMINYQRDLLPPDAVRANMIQKRIGRARKEIPQTNPPTPVTTYTVNTWKHYIQNRSQNENEPIDYPLIDMAFGVTNSKFPSPGSLDRGPFTNALVHALVNEHFWVRLSQLDAYIEAYKLEKELPQAAGVTNYDADFEKRYAGAMRHHRRLLRKVADERGVSWN